MARKPSPLKSGKKDPRKTAAVSVRHPVSSHDVNSRRTTRSTPAADLVSGLDHASDVTTGSHFSNVVVSNFTSFDKLEQVEQVDETFDSSLSCEDLDDKVSAKPSVDTSNCTNGQLHDPRKNPPTDAKKPPMKAKKPPPNNTSNEVRIKIEPGLDIGPSDFYDTKPPASHAVHAARASIVDAMVTASEASNVHQFVTPTNVSIRNPYKSRSLNSKACRPDSDTMTDDLVTGAANPVTPNSTTTTTTATVPGTVDVPSATALPPAAQLQQTVAVNQVSSDSNGLVKRPNRWWYYWRDCS